MYMHCANTYVGLLAYTFCMCNPTSLQANGFYGAGGIAGHVPSMYIYFANKFLKNINRSHRQEHVQYLEYFKPGWTFHGKGVYCVVSCSGTLACSHMAGVSAAECVTLHSSNRTVVLQAVREFALIGSGWLKQLW